MPASCRVSRSNPTPVTRRPSKADPSRRNADSSWSMIATSWPWLSRLRAREEPTRPQPMMTKCTTPTLHRGVRRPQGAAQPWRARPRVLAVPTSGRVVKRVLVGRAMRSDRLGETLLPKRLALPIFASDALSSVAYAPDEIFLTLGLAGGFLALTHSWVIGLCVVGVMLVVVASYRQNVHAYPSGGGDYEVATTNLGPKAGLTVAAALLVDYVLTVAVSISSGVQNAAAALPFIRGHEVIVAVGLVAILTAMNLRGVRESGMAFAFPVYLFMASVIGMGIVGLVREVGGTLPKAESAALTLAPEHGFKSLGSFAMMFLLLRAFSSGCAALTGVEAISNGVPAFKKPKSRNAATTLLLMGMIAITMLMAMLMLAKWTGIKYAEDPQVQLIQSNGKPVPEGYV